jgi:hypothetical protein
MGGRSSISPGRCEHHSPVLIELVGDKRFARCLLCGMLGPVRETPEEARQALVQQGRVRGWRIETGSGSLLGRL